MELMQWNPCCTTVLASAHLHLGALSQKRSTSEKSQSLALAYGRGCMEGIEVGPEMPSLPSLEGPSSSYCQTPQSTPSLWCPVNHSWRLELGAIPRGSGSDQLPSTLGQVVLSG